ncbi:hypothetical protein [Streptomyces mexicanus]|jgi:hypothetical protein
MAHHLTLATCFRPLRSTARGDVGFCPKVWWGRYEYATDVGFAA